MTLLGNERAVATGAEVAGLVRLDRPRVLVLPRTRRHGGRLSNRDIREAGKNRSPDVRTAPGRWSARNRDRERDRSGRRRHCGADEPWPSSLREARRSSEALIGNRRVERRPDRRETTLVELWDGVTLAKERDLVDHRIVLSSDGVEGEVVKVGYVEKVPELAPGAGVAGADGADRNP